METSLKTGFAQIFSCCPKNLSCPNFGGAAAPLAPPARTPMTLDHVLFYRLPQDSHFAIDRDVLTTRSWSSPGGSIDILSWIHLVTHHGCLWLLLKQLS